MIILKLLPSDDIEDPVKTGATLSTSNIETKEEITFLLPALSSLEYDKTLFII